MGTSDTAARSPWTMCHSLSRKPRFSGSSAPTARARPPRSSASTGSARPIAAVSGCWGWIRARTVRSCASRSGCSSRRAHCPSGSRSEKRWNCTAPYYRTPADWVELMSTLGLDSKRRAQYRKLSGGQKQRLSIALALVGRPRIAILDELTTGLDPQARREVWAMIEGVRDRGVTIVLVTHFMEEAERLCDRVALLDRGRVVAVDTPSALAEAAGAEQRIRFRPSIPLDDRLLTSLPEVTGVTHRGGVVLVTGTGEVVNAVTSVLARNGVVARQLRVEQANLEDAFVALTGHGPAAGQRHEAEQDQGEL